MSTKRPVEPVCETCGHEIDEWMGGYVHSLTGAKVCPGLLGVAKPKL